MPGVVEADDLGMYVVKFTGSAQGRKALVAEVIVGELARALGLRFPELVLVHFDPAIADAEPHQEVRDLQPPAPGSAWAWTTCRARATSPPRWPSRSPSTRWRPGGSCGSTR
ncbi:hypothetical protein STENM223S_06309 [Streptomyces tendae]